MGTLSREAALDFLDYVTQKGLMARATAAARKAALGKVLAILSEEEAQDVTKLDIDELMTRFGHLQGKSYTPQSLLTYRSRVRSALEDFASYVENPLAFKTSVQARERRVADVKAQPSNGSKGAESASESQPRTPTSPTSVPMSNIIPIRVDLTVYVQGVPFDLTEAEAKKIANVIQAMALPS